MSLERSPQRRLAGACASIAPLLLALCATLTLPTTKFGSVAAGLSLDAAPSPMRAEGQPLHDHLTGFVENRSQLPRGVLYEARIGELVLRCMEKGLSLRRTSPEQGTEPPTLFLDFEGAQPLVVAGAGRALAPHHYWRGFGRDAIEARSFAGVRYHGAWPGIDLVLRGGSDQLEFGLELAPGVSGEEVAIVCRGAFELREATAGALSIETSTGPLVRGVPAAWELDSAGTQRPLVARLALRGPDRFGVDIPERDLVMAGGSGPVLGYDSYQGGSNSDVEHDISQDISID